MSPGAPRPIFDAPVAAAHAEDLDLRQQQQPSDCTRARDWIDHAERTITLIDYGQSVDNMTRTVLHELAHYCDPVAGERRATRGDPVLEIVAECAAWLGGDSVLGLEMTDASATYVAAWLEAHDSDDDSVAQVNEHTSQVAKRLEEALVTPTSTP